MPTGRIHTCLAGLFILAGAVSAQEWDGERRTDFIAARVNDDFITSHEVMTRIEDVLTEIDANEIYTPEERRYHKKAAWGAELRKIAEERLLLQAAKRVGVQVSEADVEKEVRKQADEVGGMENLLKILGDEGIDLTEFQDSLRRRATSQQLLLRKFGLVEGGEGGRAQIDMFIAPREILRFYEDNREKFVEPARVKIRQIILFVHRVGSEEEALDLAESIVLQLRQGAEFAELAAEYSHGPGRKRGGTWPMETGEDGQEIWVYLKPGTARPEVEQAAFSLPSGSVSEPIAVQLGARKAYFVVEVVDNIPHRELPLRDVQASIRDGLYERRFYGNVEQIKRELLRDAYVWPSDLFAHLKKN